MKNPQDISEVTLRIHRGGRGGQLAALTLAYFCRAQTRHLRKVHACIAAHHINLEPFKLNPPESIDLAGRLYSIMADVKEVPLNSVQVEALVRLSPHSPLQDNCETNTAYRWS
jgi:hypothetical protein